MSITYKNTNAEKTTVTRDVDNLTAKTGNIYKSLVTIAKRSDQIGIEMRDELTQKLSEFATNTDNLEEIFENREQIEISKFYESLPKPVAISIQQFMEDKIYRREFEKTAEDSE